MGGGGQLGPFYGVFKFKPGSSDLEKKLGTIEAFFFSLTLKI